jgi:hypothetical protein
MSDTGHSQWDAAMDMWHGRSPLRDDLDRATAEQYRYLLATLEIQPQQRNTLAIQPRQRRALRLIVGGRDDGAADPNA